MIRDDNGWHYAKDVHSSGPLTCQYIFVLDALNFCFWPEAGLEYDYLASALNRVLTDDRNAFCAQSLAEMTDVKLQSWFPAFKIPLLSERVQRLQELGAVLADRYDGLAANVVLAAGNSATQLVRLVIESFPGFRDATVWMGSHVHFYKRAQILVGKQFRTTAETRLHQLLLYELYKYFLKDLWIISIPRFLGDIWAAYGRPSKGHLYYLAGMDRLTTFADYRVPQLLREVGVLSYSDSLAAIVDSKILIDPSSDFEIEIRASTILAVDMLHKVCNLCNQISISLISTC